MDLFTFSNLVELLSVLDVSLCDFEIPLLDREALIYARKTMRIVLMFFFNKYTIEESGETLDKPKIKVSAVPRAPYYNSSCYASQKGRR